ncbi:hypothetical protein HPULCUR_005522 [Helicostylum pulchrum]|uniref:CCZ1/INTU/HSP4 first Longin domain-containing protein n=1 Tax=Helicostylum pulchrum TaxID=562976 RepID=A0ABP9XZB4_9FUNG
MNNGLRVKNTRDISMKFVYDFFVIFIGQIINKRDILSRLETIYNHHAIFQFFDATISATPSCMFYPGETRLKAISNELRRQELTSQSYYNADGIIFHIDSLLELCLLETTGPFGLVDIPRESNDQVKAAYGLLSMLHTIAYEFDHADIEIFRKQRIYFVHAAQNYIRLWSFSLVDKELYILTRIDSSSVPTSVSKNFEMEFKKVVNLFWKLKVRKTQKDFGIFFQNSNSSFLCFK